MNDDATENATMNDDATENATMSEDATETPMSEGGADSGCLALPPDVVDAIESRLPRTEYGSVEAYAVAALRGLLREAAAAPEDPDRAAAGGGDEGVDSAAGGRGDDGGDGGRDDDLEDRLDSLGYL